MSWWDDVTGFISDNKDILKTVAGTGLSVAKNMTQDNAASDYQNYLKQAEAANYQNYLNEVNAYNAAGQDAAARANANSAAAAANANARNAAAAATDKNRKKAAAKASKAQQKGYKEALAMLAPYVQAGTEVLPAKKQTYLDALNRMKSMGAYLDSPQQMANATLGSPASQIPVLLPDYTKRG